MILKSIGLLHPELVLDRRGADKFRMLYKKAHDCIEWITIENGDKVRKITDSSLSALFEADMNLFRLISITKEFKEKKAKTFCMGKSIMQALMEVDSKLPIELLPENWLGYVVFPKNVVSDGEHYYQGAYVHLASSRDLGIMSQITEADSRAFCIVAISEDMEYNATLCDSFDKNPTLKSVGENIEKNPSLMGISLPEAGKEVFRAALSSVLFINSQEPDLREAKPLNVSATQAKKTGKDYVEDLTMPVTLVDWSWVPGSPNYEKQIWYQKAHWSTRWSGIGRMLPKAVFVKGSWHERKL